MLDGVQLNLLLGTAVPAPAPRALLDALTSVQVTAAARQPSGFQLTFQMPARSPLQTMLLLSGGSVPKVRRAVIYVTLRNRPEVLIDGVITDHQVTPGVGGAPATMTVTGSDLTAVMNLVSFNGVPYPALSPEARVALVVAKYASFGVIPIIIPRVMTDVPNPVEHFARHQGTDLEYLNRLAEASGFVFCHEPGPAPGTSFAYWGPEIRTGQVQAALSADLDADSNLESLNFRFDHDSASRYVAYVRNPLTKAPVPVVIPSVSLLSPPLGLVQPPAKRLTPLETAKLSPIRAALLGLARQARSEESLTGSGTLDVLRYGQVLRPRRLVGVRGAGAPFDGLHYVQSVTHNIRPGEYKQSFTLSRNGLLPTVSPLPA